jgi:hypothetical protein
MTLPSDDSRRLSSQRDMLFHCDPESTSNAFRIMMPTDSFGQVPRSLGSTESHSLPTNPRGGPMSAAAHLFRP